MKDGQLQTLASFTNSICVCVCVRVCCGMMQIPPVVPSRESVLQRPATTSIRNQEMLSACRRTPSQSSLTPIKVHKVEHLGYSWLNGVDLAIVSSTHHWTLITMQGFSEWGFKTVLSGTRQMNRTPSHHRCHGPFEAFGRLLCAHLGAAGFRMGAGHGQVEPKDGVLPDQQSAGQRHVQARGRCSYAVSQDSPREDHRNERILGA